MKNENCIVGIDPGSASGSYAVLTLDGKVLFTGCFKKKSPHDFKNDMKLSIIGSIALVWVEKVGAMPGQGIVSAFHFAENFGMIQGVLATLEVPHEIIRPLEWQRLLGIKPRVKKNKKKGITGESTTEWKNRLKAVAQRLFPKMTITLQIADGLLIAEAARREYLARVTK